MDRKTEEKILFGLVFITLISAAIYMSLGPSNVNVKATGEQRLESKIGKIAASYVKNNMLPPGSTVYWGDVNEKENLYEVELEIYDGRDMRKSNTYMTKDMKIFFPSGVSFSSVSKRVGGTTNNEKALNFAITYLTNYGEKVEITESLKESGVQKIVINADETGEIVIFMTTDGEMIFPQYSYM